MGKTLIIGMGEIGVALTLYHEARELDYAIITRTLRGSVLGDASISRTHVIELGVQLLPASLLRDVDTIIYAAGTPRPGAPLSTTAAVVSDELVPLQALIATIDDSDWHGTFIFASSGGTIYGRSELGTPWIETDPCHPVSAYGIAKYAAENFLVAAAARAGFKLVIARISNVIGTRLNFEMGIGFVQTAVHRILDGLPLEIYGDGSTTRDFIDLIDVATILPSLALHSSPSVLLVNISTGIPTSLMEVIATVESETGILAKLKFSPPRSSDVSNNLLCNYKLNSLVSPTYTPFIQSVRRLISDFTPSQESPFVQLTIRKDTK